MECLSIVTMLIMCLYECEPLAKCLGDGGEGVESYAVAAFLDADDVRPLHSNLVGKVLLCHALLFAQLGDVLPYALPFLFVLDHSSFAFENSLSLNMEARPLICFSRNTSSASMPRCFMIQWSVLPSS